MEKLRFFEEAGIGAMCFLAGKGAEDYLEIDERGLLVIPPGVNPTGFHLVLVILKGARIVIAQKNVAQDRGGYHRYSLAWLGDSSSEGCSTWVLHEPIRVIRTGQNVWTSWHRLKPNRVDCWLTGEGGHVDLFQVGVVTHDNGQTFRLLGEWRWRGQLYQDRERRIVGKPDDPTWGNFDVRRPILDDPDFQKLLDGVPFPFWQGKPEELDPPLGAVPGPGFARMQWYVAFAGQTGQGPAVLYDGSSAWVHGADILDPPDPDGVHRLHLGDLVKYDGIQENWGSKKDGPPKLLCVRRVR